MRQPHLFWIYSGYLLQELDAATWLETSRELTNLGWRVTLVAAGETSELRSVRGVDVLLVRRPDVYLLRQVFFHLRVLALLLRQWGQVDVVLFHQGSAPYILPLTVVRALWGGRGPRLVKDTRTVPMTRATRRDRVRALFERTMDWASNRLADGQTIITRRMADAVGVPAGKRWGYWPSGVNAEWFAGCSAQRVWPADHEPVRLIYIGSLYRERNLAELCHAVARCRRAGMNVFLTIVGAGPQQAELAGLAHELADCIEVLPAVPHSAVPDLLTRAHVGVLPFPDQEIFRVSSPIKLFEYMAAGMPILATRIVCHTDVVGDQPFVFWADGGDVESLAAAVAAVRRATVDLPRLGHQSARAVTDWTWNAAARKLSKALLTGHAEATVAQQHQAVP